MFSGSQNLSHSTNVHLNDRTLSGTVIIAVVPQNLAQCLALSRCSLNTYQRNCDEISNVGYRLTVVALVSIHLAGCHLNGQHRGQSCKSRNGNALRSDSKERMDSSGQPAWSNRKALASAAGTIPNTKRLQDCVGLRLGIQVCCLKVYR